MWQYLNEKERQRARGKITNAARQMIMAEDLKSLERLYMRLSCRPTWSEMLLDAVIIAAATCSDPELCAGVQFVKNAAALADCGLKSDGSH